MFLEKLMVPQLVKKLPTDYSRDRQTTGCHNTRANPLSVLNQTTECTLLCFIMLRAPISTVSSASVRTSQRTRSRLYYILYSQLFLRLKCTP